MNDFPIERSLMICKGCGGKFDELPKRGKYANRCADCRRGLGASRSSHPKGAGVGLGGDTFEAKAKSLVSCGRQVDRAIADVRLNAAGLNDAKTLAHQALEQWKSACLRLAGAAER